MLLQLSFLPTFFVALGVGAATAVDAAVPSAAPTKTPMPCTISSAAGAFYDLNDLRVQAPGETKKLRKGARVEDWKVRGYDYHENQANFTLNLCGALASPQKDFVGIDESLWSNVSAFYELGAHKFSIGQQNSTLRLRGRRLVLEYHNGSPCGTEASNKDNNRRKSSIFSFHCDKDPLAAPSSGLVTYVGTLDDECAYYFEVLSNVACITTEPAKQSVGPGAVFAIIGFVAILVYLLGGVFYQRNVAHARGWRQLPNYSMWASIGNFVTNIYLISVSTCTSFLPHRFGYTVLSNSYGRGRPNRIEDENRLIDQLDEEWED
ncbi:BgTH12-02837 [Blumeria graminis f. sp. triticale]|uniref:Bgt-3563 n=3 Tax=Blumeria graminis TaxID=34373 RepID=A0A381LCI4_BLUGR|nr:Membrane protein [Blumeria graminis f. sp. tritici 96224]CAD6503169.1 BgTH12-02837 [Blumeria graminis f. sp. triticale]VDB89142.1 Bgt-3563 [Blumeria graminis f. sp. tritici]